MAKNLVEIILDSSGSMREPAFGKVEKFVIAKALLNEILEDILIPSSSKIFIKYFRNCKVLHINNYQEIHYLEAEGTTPLFKAIAMSIHNLVKQGKGYNKSIIILTDGKDNCGEISNENLIQQIKESTFRKNKISIYIIQIGDYSRTKQQQFEYFTKETNGKHYFINFNQDFSKVIFEIKKDFKVIFDIKKDFKLNRHLFKKFIWILQKLLDVINVIVFMLLSLSLLSHILNFDKKETPPIHKNITSCEKKITNKIEVTTCTFLKDKKTQAIIYTFNNSNIIIFKDFPSARSTFKQSRTLFLHDVFYSQITPFKEVKNISLFGHTDLQRVSENDNLDSFNHYCKSNNIPTNSNECLGTIRALSVKDAIDKIKYPFKNIFISYKNDFFMRDTNNFLKGTLFKAMDLEDTVSVLQKKLNIDTKYDPKTIRENFKNQDLSLSQYKKEFSPFRSVVVIVERKKSLIDFFQKNLKEVKNYNIHSATEIVAP